MKKNVKPTWVELSEAYAEAASHLELCACEAQTQQERDAYNQVSRLLNKKSRSIAQKGVNSPTATGRGVR